MLPQTAVLACPLLTFPVTSGSTSGAATKEDAKDVHGRARVSPPITLPVSQRRLPPAVIQLPLAGIGQDRVGFRDLFELQRERNGINPHPQKQKSYFILQLHPKLHLKFCCSLWESPIYIITRNTLPDQSHDDTRRTPPTYNAFCCAALWEM